MSGCALESRPAQCHAKPPQLEATGPNQVWSWDITYLPTLVNGIFLYAYVLMDVWSRKIVGWEIHSEESEAHARDFFRRVAVAYNVEGVHLHADNGNAMKGVTILALFFSLGILPSYSRPRVSNDNPFSESLFKTVKFRPGYPRRFKDIHHARQWFADFGHWYNTEHRHSGPFGAVDSDLDTFLFAVHHPRAEFDFLYGIVAINHLRWPGYANQKRPCYF